ncbi:Hypothetical_protein [Hexamita inflata]|uniref:Hypothetical_protein n=1 Tax=Hexamita inflata TaxID=28002 RepID=A0AA86TX13_9EUKA|nr:Hypothetical protein HINF_LOCUS17912 [Hexamita inflata]
MIFTEVENWKRFRKIKFKYLTSYFSRSEEVGPAIAQDLLQLDQTARVVLPDAAHNALRERAHERLRQRDPRTGEGEQDRRKGKQVLHRCARAEERGRVQEVQRHVPAARAVEREGGADHHGPEELLPVRREQEQVRGGVKRVPFSNIFRVQYF